MTGAPVEKNRIPAAASGQFVSWTLPQVKDGRVVEVVPRREADQAAPEAPTAPSITASELEAITEQAWQEGKEQGYREGHAEGLAAGQAEGLAAGRAAAAEELKRELAQLRKVMSQLMDPIADQEAAIDASLLRLSLDIARAVIDAEPALPPERLLRVVREAVRQLPVGERNFTVLLHPDQAAAVAGAGWPSSWRIESDERLQPGGCRVQGEHTLVDYSVELRFRQVAARLLAEDSAETPEPGLLLEDDDGEYRG